MDNYIIIEDTVIFKDEFNDLLDNYTNIISKYNKLIFSNYSNPLISKEIENCLDDDDNTCILYKFSSGSLLSNKFNQIVNLTHLIFNYCFNQIVDQTLPNLTHLTLGHNFNQLINLPTNIKHLNFYNDNQYLMDNLPNGIKEITFSTFCSYNEELNCLPKSVEYIKLNYNYNKKIVNIPNELTKIVCYKEYKFIDDFTNKYFMCYS
jgi:hypothetical protein